MDLNKYIIDNDKNKPFHSNGFAKVSDDSKNSVISPITYKQRQQIDRNRQVIGSYRSSTLGNTYGVVKARPITSGADKIASKRFNQPNPRHNPYA